MSYIFMDESGELGFDFKKEKTSKFFVVTFIFTKDKNTLNKIVKKSLKIFLRIKLRNIQVFYMPIKKLQKQDKNY